jgi:HNH endonuclease
MYYKEIKVLSGLKNGYVQFRDWEHPLHYVSDGSVYLHRHVASIMLGRWILPSEVVHHKDFDKLNNNPNNLEILTQEQHSKLHNQSLRVSCINCLALFIPHNNNSKFCSQKCYKSSLVKNKEITKELLEELKPTMTWIALGKLFGYSDNGIKKRAKSLGCKF